MARSLKKGFYVEPKLLTKVERMNRSGDRRPIKTRELGLSGSIKLASNESPLGPSPKAVAALQKAIAGIHRYPDGASFELRRKLAERLAVEEEQLVFGAGADEILELLSKVLLGPGDECVFAWPSFAMYPIVVKGMGARAVQVPLDREFVHDLPAMRGAVTKRTKLVFVSRRRSGGTAAENFSGRPAPRKRTSTPSSSPTSTCSS